MKILVAATVIDTVGYLSQVFKVTLREDPRIDPYGSLSFLLEHNFKGYANEDPGVIQQNALSIFVLLKAPDLYQKNWQQQWHNLSMLPFSL